MAIQNPTPIDMGGNTLYVQNIKTGYTKAGQGGLIDSFGNLAGGSTKTLTQANTGQWVNLDTASGTQITLPGATGSGTAYTVYCGTTVTSNNHVVKTNGTDTMVGVFVLAGTTSLSGPITGTNKTITMNGTTTGGIKGTYITATDIALNVWLIEASIVGSGTVTTPMS